MISLALVSILPFAASSAQAPVSGQPSPQEVRPSVVASLRDFAARNGRGWGLVGDEETGLARMVYGGRAKPTGPARSNEDFAARAREAVVLTAGLHGVDAATLGQGKVIFLPLRNAGTTDKVTVELHQSFGGVSVNRGTVNVLFDLEGGMLSVDATALPETSAFETAPTLTPAQAIATADAFFSAEAQLVASELTTPRLAIEQVVTANGREGRLVWEVEARRDLAGAQPVGYRYAIDAADGSVVGRTQLVHNAWDVSGKVTSLVTPGVEADRPTNPEVEEPMPYIMVSDGTASAITDEFGDFTIPGISAPVDLTVIYFGQYANSTNHQGPEYSLTVTALTDSGNMLQMNPLALEFDTAQANAYHWTNKLRQWIKGVNAFDTSMDRRFLARCNIADVCNAYYNGRSVNFFIDSVACPNSAYSSVVVHELGHWLNEIYSSGNGPDGFGEGNADVYAMYILDDPVVGRGFLAGMSIRDGENTRQLCNDDTTRCYPAVHDAGEVLMGALWKVRRNLKNAHGDMVGGAIADTLFNSWMNAYNDRQIRPIIELHWLVLDDNNGFVADGTPHFEPIDSAFREQGFPGLHVTIDRDKYHDGRQGGPSR